jgi:hypothetical protein
MGEGRGLVVVVNDGKLPNVVFLFMAWCSFVGVCQHFGATCFLLFHAVRNEDKHSPKRGHPPKWLRWSHKNMDLHLRAWRLTI